MKDPDCNCSSEVIWRYIDRELSARDMAGVSERIRSCDTCRGMYEEQALLARSLSSGFVDSPFGGHSALHGALFHSAKEFRAVL